MKREFLQGLQVGDMPLTKEVIDAIMAENGKDIEAVKAHYADYDGLKEQFDKQVETHRREMSDLIFSHNLENAILSAKGRNARTPNAAPNSRHIYGQAADFHIDGVEPAEIAKYAESIGVKGIGLYDTFVHIDTRETKSFWYSHAQEYRATFGGAPAEEYPLEQFIRDVQKACGAAVDGIAGPETLSKTVTLSAYKNCTHKAVTAVQKRLYSMGYTQVGEADGIAGVKFTAAVQAFQRNNRCWVDGEITAGNKTWKKLLGMEQGVDSR